MNSGIYMIYCTENNKPYIGKAENLDDRKLQHFSHLKKLDINTVLNTNLLKEKDEFWLYK